MSPWAGAQGSYKCHQRRNWVFQTCGCSCFVVGWSVSVEFFHSFQYAVPNLIILKSVWEIWLVLVQIQRNRSWADCEMWIKSFKWNCFTKGNNLNAYKTEGLNMKEMFIEKMYWWQLSVVLMKIISNCFILTIKMTILPLFTKTNIRPRPVSWNIWNNICFKIRFFFFVIQHPIISTPVNRTL